MKHLILGGALLVACGEVVAPSSDVTITVAMNGNGSGRITSMPEGIDCPTNCSATFDKGTAVTLQAAPAAGAVFAGYGAACAGLEPTCSVTADADKEVSAGFALPGETRFATQIDGVVLSTVVPDAAGNVLVAGSLVRTAGTGAYVSLRAGSDGSVIWEHTFIELTSPSVAFTPSGDIAFVAEFAGTPSFGGRALMNGGAVDFVIAELSAADGTVTWAQEYGGNLNDVVDAIAVTESGAYYVGGAFMSSGIRFGNVTLAHTAGTAANYDGFVAAFSPQRAFLWAQRYSGPDTEQVTSLITDSQGNLIVGGAFIGTVDLGAMSYSSTDIAGFALRARANDGVSMWTRSFGASGIDHVHDVAIGANDSMTITGFFTTTQSFGGTNLQGRGGADVFAASYNAAGTHRWSNSFGSTAMDQAYAVAIDAKDMTYIAGAYALDATFGQTTLTNGGGDDAFAAMLTETGSVAWARRFGGAGRDVAKDVAAGAFNTLYVVGQFERTADMGGPTLTTASEASFLVSLWR